MHNAECMESVDNKKKVFVGLSGGVDSSVSAYLLKKQGYDVSGVFIKVWQPDFLSCTWPEDRRDAMRVCATLGIPFRTLDLEEVYKREVVDYMVSEYEKGRTPNPDVMCNRYVKFGAFLEWARNEGADFVATGHYARVQNREESPVLFSGLDQEKDQTYFLWQLTKEDLKQILFPVGGLQKSEVRKVAKEAGLTTAEKKDSQGLCFLGKLDMKDFLKRFIKERPGIVTLQNGKRIGTHTGALFYTLGERRGFTITDPHFNMPLYVVDKHIKENTLIVAPETKVYDHAKKEVPLEATNWLEEINEDTEYKARIRHRGELHPVRVLPSKSGETSVLFLNEPPLVSSGQSLVVYGATADGWACVGGGIVA